MLPEEQPDIRNIKDTNMEETPDTFRIEMDKLTPLDEVEILRAENSRLKEENEKLKEQYAALEKKYIKMARRT